MPPKSQAKSLPADIVAQILLGEAAGEGPEGLQFVRDVMVNRSRRTGKTLEEVATAPAQFSAYARSDLDAFYRRQPDILRNLARELVAEAKRPDFQPQYPGIEHYVTQDLWRNVDEFAPSHWLHQMEPAFTLGRHVALRPRQRQ